MTRNGILALGIAAVLVETALWHGPLGAGDRFAAKVEAEARAALDHAEMYKVAAHFERRPMRRTMVLAGPGDDFQQSELVRIVGDVPGVGDVRWANPPTVVKPL